MATSNTKTLIGILVVTTLAAATGVILGIAEIDKMSLKSAPSVRALSVMPVMPAIDVDMTAAPTPIPEREAQPAPPPPAAPQPAAQPATSRAGACMFGGAAAAGTTIIIGPAEIAALLAGLALLPVSTPLTAAVLAGSFATGCAATALLAPSFR